MNGSGRWARIRRTARHVTPSAPTARVVVICVLAVLVALPALLTRLPADAPPGRVDVAVVDSAVQQLPERAEILPRLADAGAGTVVLGLRSLEDVLDHDRLSVIDPKYIDDTSVVPRAIAGDPSYTIIKGQPGDRDGLFGRTAAALKSRYGDQVKVVRTPAENGPIPFLRVPKKRELLDLAIDFDRKRLTALAAEGSDVVLSLPSRAGSDGGWLQREIAVAVERLPVRGVMAVGELPYFAQPSARTGFQTFLEEHDLRLYLPDLGEAMGAETYLPRFAGDVVRVHLVNLRPGDDLEMLGARARRAVKERGVSMIVLRPPPRHVSAQLDPGQTVAFVASLGSRWPAGAVTGPAAPTPAVEPGSVARAGALLGALLIVGASTAWLVRAVRRPRWRLPERSRWPRRPPGIGWLAGRLAGRLVAPDSRVTALVVAGTGIVGALGVLGGVTFAWKLLALLTAVLGATLAVVAAMAIETRRRTRRHGPAHGARARLVRFGQLVTAYAVAVGIALATALVAAALGARSAFLADATTFSGVKVLLLLPPLLVTAYAAARLTVGPNAVSRRFRVPRDRRTAWAWLRARLRRWHVVVAVVVVVAAAYYLVRSGNSGLAPGFELALRDRLDEALYVRPRFKEFLLGLPALVVALWWPGAIGRWCLAVVGTIGTASIVDTFVHFAMPVWVSLLRTGYGVLGGLLLGVVLVALVRPLRRRWRSGGER